MALTVDSAFEQFYENINLSGDHRSTANDRKERLIALLAAKFEVLDSFGTGSIPRFTALKDHADVDIMVVLHYGKHIKGKTPSRLLQDVRDALAFKTTVRKNGQAVTLYYQSWPNVDVVPVSQVTDSKGNVAHYNVPNANNETWIPSRPRTHSRSIESKAIECGENFRRIIKMIKWWNIGHGDLLQSFHIEVLATLIFSTKVDDTPWNVLRFFDESHKHLLNSLWHNGAQVDAYLGNAERRDVVRKLQSVTAQAKVAWHGTYGSNSNHKDAISKWQAIFGDKFPTYG